MVGGEGRLLRGASYSRGGSEPPSEATGGSTFPYPGIPVWGGNLPRGRSKLPSGSAGRPHLSNNRVHLIRGGRWPSPGGGRVIVQGPWGAVIFHESGAPAWVVTGGQAQGVVEASVKAYGGSSSCKSRAHHPGGNRQSSPGCGQGILQSLWGAIILRELGAWTWAGRRVQPRGWSGPPARPLGSHHPRKTGRIRLRGTGKSG